MLQSAETFEELHDDRVAPFGFKSVGPLIIHDTAYRTASKLGLELRLVYLHRGTLEGAVLLAFDRRRAVLNPTELPPASRALRLYEIEDCLCMYKKAIARIVRVTIRLSSAVETLNGDAQAAGEAALVVIPCLEGGKFASSISTDYLDYFWSVRGFLRRSGRTRRSSRAATTKSSV